MKNGPRVSPDFNLSSKDRKIFMRNVYECISILYDFFGDEEKCIVWLDTPNLNFGFTRPIDLMNQGRINKVLLWLRQAKRDNQPPKVSSH